MRSFSVLFTLKLCCAARCSMGWSLSKYECCCPCAEPSLKPDETVVDSAAPACAPARCIAIMAPVPDAALAGGKSAHVPCTLEKESASLTLSASNALSPAEYRASSACAAIVPAVAPELDPALAPAVDPAALPVAAPAVSPAIAPAVAPAAAAVLVMNGSSNMDHESPRSPLSPLSPFSPRSPLSPLVVRIAKVADRVSRSSFVRVSVT